MKQAIGTCCGSRSLRVGFVRAEGIDLSADLGEISDDGRAQVLVADDGFPALEIDGDDGRSNGCYGIGAGFFFLEKVKGDHGVWIAVGYGGLNS